MQTILETYAKQKYSLSVEEADQIYGKIQSQMDLSDEDDHDIIEMVLTSARKYADKRAEWILLTRKERQDKDESRSLAHDSFIRNIDILARYMEGKGGDASWRDDLGDLKKDPSYRKRIGDFACFLVLFAGLEAR